MLGAGEPGDVADVLDRRLTLMVDTFVHPVYPELLAACALALVAGLLSATPSSPGSATPGRLAAASSAP